MKATGKMIKLMVLDTTIIKMDHFIEDFGAMIHKMVEELRDGQMGLNLREITLQESKKVVANSPGAMVTCMKATSRIITSWDMEPTDGVMDVPTRVNGKTIK